jgi:hypothetical protein
VARLAADHNFDARIAAGLLLAEMRGEDVQLPRGLRILIDEEGRPLLLTGIGDFVTNAAVRTAGKQNTTIKHTVKHKGQTHNRQAEVRAGAGKLTPGHDGCDAWRPATDLEATGPSRQPTGS